MSEVIVGLLIVYCHPVNGGIGTRDVIFLHFGVPAAPFALIILFYDEIRKILVNRAAEVKKGQKPGWWFRNYAY